MGLRRRQSRESRIHKVEDDHGDAGDTNMSRRSSHSACCLVRDGARRGRSTEGKARAPSRGHELALPPWSSARSGSWPRHPHTAVQGESLPRLAPRRGPGPALRGLDRGHGQRTTQRRATRPAGSPSPHPRRQRLQLPASRRDAPTQECRQARTTRRLTMGEETGPPESKPHMPHLPRSRTAIPRTMRPALRVHRQPRLRRGAIGSGSPESFPMTVALRWLHR